MTIPQHCEKVTRAMMTYSAGVTSNKISDLRYAGGHSHPLQPSHRDESVQLANMGIFEMDYECLIAIDTDTDLSDSRPNLLSRWTNLPNRPPQEPPFKKNVI